MSRSYRQPYYVSGGTGKKYYKRFANKKVRRYNGVSDHKFYKKIYESWDICDYKYRWTPGVEPLYRVARK